MTAPAPCPCPPAGHECRPNWVTEAEWGDPVAERPGAREWRTRAREIAIDQVVLVGNKSARSGDPLGKGLNTPGLTTPDVTWRALMDSTYPQPDRDLNNQVHP